VIHYFKIEENPPNLEKGPDKQKVELMERYHPRRAGRAAAGVKRATSGDQRCGYCRADPKRNVDNCGHDAAMKMAGF
jgi:hypothetical protein